jgi:lysophospholipase L1-like esterase
MMRITLSKAMAALATVACIATTVAAGVAFAADDNGANGGRWITAWGASQQPNTTPVVVNNATVRVIARVTIPGDAVSFRLDNTFGATPVTIGSAFVGPRIQGARLAVGLNRQATFAGSPSVTIPVGGSVQSDPVALRVFARQDLAVSLYIPGSATASQHGGAVVTSYLTADDAGDVAATEANNAYARRTTSMPWLKSIDVRSTASTGAIVAFGDSITDGTCTTLDAHDRWEDWVSVRLDTAGANGDGAPGTLVDQRHRADPDGGHKSMVNEGIGGNTVTRANLGPAADSTPGIERFDRDVLGHRGVTDVVVFMGTNDIRRGASAKQVVAGLQDIANRIHTRGYSAISVTIIPRHNVAPSGTNTGWDPAKTAIRNEVNQWIRTTPAFDAVLDFDEAVRDPSNHDLLDPAFNCGDGIHPSPAGYYHMGKSVDLDVFSGKGR